MASQSKAFLVALPTTFLDYRWLGISQVLILPKTDFYLTLGHQSVFSAKLGENLQPNFVPRPDLKYLSTPM